MTHFRLPKLHEPLIITLLLGIIVVSGCASPWSKRASLEEQIQNDPNYSIAGIQGPNERRLRSASWKREREQLVNSGDPAMAKALNEYEKARELFDQKKYAEAEKAFHNLVSQRRDTYESTRAKWERWWGARPAETFDPYSNFGDPIEEDALFMQARCQFERGRYADAQNSYSDLLNRYPSSRHLDDITRDLFRIARSWLGFPESIGEDGDVQVASAESKDPPPALLPNLTDKSRPTFDTGGRGLQALRSIWLNDAAGPLADDALMLAANYHLKNENFTESARLYTLLREQYPDSPHVKDAFLLGSHVTLASYEGPGYDGKALQESLQLKQTMLQAFPDLTPGQRQMLEGEVAKLSEAEVAREWDRVEFYRIKGHTSAVALHCYNIINHHPDSKYAGMARKVLQDLKAQGKSEPWWDIALRRQTAQAKATEPKQVEESKRSFFGLLKKADTPPELQPAEDPSEPGKVQLN